MVVHLPTVFLQIAAASWKRKELPPAAFGVPAVVIGWLLASPCALGQQTTELVSVDSSGNQTNQVSYDHSISGDGRFVAFQSFANNLVPGDTNGAWDVFVRDRQTGVTERVSLDSSGNQANSTSTTPSISGDGRYVAFQSAASNLAPVDTNNTYDVFVHDRQTGITQIASADLSGNAGNNISEEPAISADGQFVAFQSRATNLVPGGTNGREIFVHDRQTGVTEIASVDSSGIEGNGSSYSPAISELGRFVAFYGSATNLVPGDINGETDAFVHDRLTGLTEMVSVDSSGNQGNEGSYYPSISSDGRYVAFSSDASNLVPGDETALDVFVHDRQAGVTQIVSSGFPDEAGFGYHEPAISGDGRHVAFVGELSGSGWRHVFAYDRQTGVTEVLSVDTSGNPANGESGDFGRSDISEDGRYVTFVSNATTLVPGDTNGFRDVFLRDRSCSDTFVNYCTAGTSANNCAVSLNASGTASSSAASGFVVTAPFAEGQKDGMFIFSQNGPQANPWGNGTSYLCLVPPVKRAGLLQGNGTAGLCDATISQDLNALWCSSCPKPSFAPMPSKQLQVQFWYRDPASTSNQPSSLSDALEVTVCPK